MILGTFAVSHWFGAVAALGVILAAIYLLWSYQRMAYGPVHDEHTGLPDLCLREVVVLVPDAALLLVFGVYPEPRARPDRIPTRRAVHARRRVHPDAGDGPTVGIRPCTRRPVRRR